MIYVVTFTSPATLVAENPVSFEAKTEREFLTSLIMYSEIILKSSKAFIKLDTKNSSGEINSGNSATFTYKQFAGTIK